MKKQICIQLDYSVIELLKSMADKEGITVSAYIRRLILRDLEK